MILCAVLSISYFTLFKSTFKVFVSKMQIEALGIKSLGRPTEQVSIINLFLLI